MLETVGHQSGHRNGQVIAIGRGDALDLLAVGKTVKVLPRVSEHDAREGDEPRQLHPHQHQGQESETAVDGIILGHIDLSAHKQPLHHMEQRAAQDAGKQGRQKSHLGVRHQIVGSGEHEPRDDDRDE